MDTFNEEYYTVAEECIHFYCVAITVITARVSFCFLPIENDFTITCTSTIINPTTTIQCRVCICGNQIVTSLCLLLHHCPSERGPGQHISSLNRHFSESTDHQMALLQYLVQWLKMEAESPGCSQGQYPTGEACGLSAKRFQWHHVPCTMYHVPPWGNKVSSTGTNTCTAHSRGQGQVKGLLPTVRKQGPLLQQVEEIHLNGCRAKSQVAVGQRILLAVWLISPGVTAGDLATYSVYWLFICYSLSVLLLLAC